MNFAYQQQSYHNIKDRDETRFKYNIEYQPSYARYDLQMNQKDAKKKMAFKVRNGIRNIVHKFDKVFKTNISVHLSKKQLQYEDYDALCNEIINRKPDSEKAIPGMFVGWDNTPRRGNKGRVCVGSTPEKFEKYLSAQIDNTRDNYKKDKLFIFAWNEWAEGGYLEPDSNNQYAYLEAIDKSLSKFR